MKSNQIDGKELAADIRLPYFVPVDFIIRFFVLILLSFMLFGFFTCFQNPKGTIWYEWVFLGAGFLLSLYVFARPSGLSVREDGIVHKKYLFLTRKVRWIEIEKVITGTQNFIFSYLGVPLFKLKGTLGIVDNSRGPYLMIFFLKNGKKPFLLNIKPYTRKGLAIFAYFLTTKASHADLDEASRNLTVGIVPSVFFPTKHKE